MDRILVCFFSLLFIFSACYLGYFAWFFPKKYAIFAIKYKNRIISKSPTFLKDFVKFANADPNSRITNWQVRFLTLLLLIIGLIGFLASIFSPYL